MRKTRALFLLAATLLSIAAYVAWAAWDPAPTIQSMTFDETVDATARSHAEEDFRLYPPKARKLTWDRFLSRLANPYQPREKPSIRVAIVPYTDGGKLMSIDYPRRKVWLARRLVDGRWGRDPTVDP